MTFIFFLGVLAIFLPIGLGAAAFGKFFSRYHNVVFGVGGILLVGLGAMLLSGKHFSLPFKVSPALKKHNAFSVFMLGVFSAIATTCCAPVLAGVLALAALPGSMFWGGIYTVSYVFGMVAPLFLISLFLDKIDFTQKFSKVLSKSIKYHLGKKEVSITVSEVVSGITFLAMGVLISYLALSNKLFAHGEYQTSINIYLTKVLQAVSGIARAVPEYIWAALLITVVGTVVWWAIYQFKKEKND